MTRREQLGSEDHQLKDKPAKTKPIKRPAAAKGRGRGRGKKAETVETEDKNAETVETEDKNAETVELENKETVETEDKNAETVELENKETVETEDKNAETVELENKETVETEDKNAETVELENKETVETEVKTKGKGKGAAKAKAKDKETAVKTKEKEKKTVKTKSDKTDDTGKGTKRPKSDKDDKDKQVKKPRTAEPKVEAKAKKNEEKRIETATWAGRWVPSDPGQHTRMAAIKAVFDQFVGPKVRSQSTLASPFFKVCTGAFKTQGLTESTSYDDFVASAELEVEGFMKLECVRCLDFNVGTRFPFLLLRSEN